MMRAVLFDAAHTLLDPDPPSARVYAAIGARHGYRVTEETLGAALRPLWWPMRAEKEARTMVSGTHEELEWEWWRGLVDRAFRDAGEPRGIGEECFEAIYDHFAHGSAWKVFEDVRPTLARLRARGIRCGVCSNFDSRLNSVLADHDLLDSFDSLTISSLAGWEKPHPNIYKSALAALGAEAPETLMVGDDWHHDVKGPRAAGMQAVWLRRQGPTENQPSIASLLDIPELTPDSPALK